MNRLQKKFLTLLLAAALTVGLLPVRAQAAEPTNTSKTTAIPIVMGQEITLSGTGSSGYYYSFTTTEDAQILMLSVTTTATTADFVLYDESGNYCNTYDPQSAHSEGTAVLESAGKGNYYLLVTFGENGGTVQFTPTLKSNDAFGINNTADTAAPLPLDTDNTVLLLYRLDNYYSITTTKDAQDIQINLSGFGNLESANIEASFDGNGSFQYSRDTTLYYHAAKAGLHTFRLCSLSQPVSQLTVRASLLADEDPLEPNDTSNQAVPLPVSTTKSFSLGGYQDEDWFSFEASIPDGQTSALYTLRFSGLKTDYTDRLYYDIYDPDGKIVGTNTGVYVNIQHANIFTCAKAGTYRIRVYTQLNNGVWGEIRPALITRSVLKISVDEGGTDPNESNDTWRTATPIQVGQTVPLVLDSTSDQDWFCFDVPKPGMTINWSCSRAARLELYTAEELSASSGPSTLAGSPSDTTEYRYKLTAPGRYYLLLMTDTSNSSSEPRTMSVGLEEGEAAENNDSWETATPIYPNVPQAFTLSAFNDYDWFRIVVPANMEALSVGFSAKCTLHVYRGQDLLDTGDDVSEIASKMDYGVSATNVLTLDHPAADSYYLKLIANNTSSLNTTQATSGSITCSFTSSGKQADAVSLTAGTWSAPVLGPTWFSIGERKAGETVRVALDAKNGLRQFSLYSSDGTKTGGTMVSEDATLSIPSNGTYFLFVEASAFDANDRETAFRIRFDAGAVTPYQNSVKGPDSLTLALGASVYLDTQLLPVDAAGGDYSSRSVTIDDSNIVSSAGNGYLTAVAVGKTNVHGCYSPYDDTMVKEIPVTVIAPTKLTVTGGEGDTLLPGQTRQLTAVLEPAGLLGGAAWSSSDPAILDVDPSTGLVTATGEGTATITAKAGTLTQTLSLTVGPAPEEVAVENVVLNHYSATVYLDEDALQLTASVLPANAVNSAITWTSSDMSVASVDKNGLATFLKLGVSVLTATAGNGVRSSCVVTVLPKRVRVTGAAFEGQQITLGLYDTTTLHPTISPADATVQTLLWSSDDSTIATVTRTGAVTGISVGQTYIKATTADGGYSAKILVVVSVTQQLGDVSSDGYIDAADAMLILRYTVHALTLTDDQLKAADVTRDGVVNVGDAVKILRYDAGLISAL